MPLRWKGLKDVDSFLTRNVAFKYVLITYELFAAIPILADGATCLLNAKKGTFTFVQNSYVKFFISAIKLKLLPLLIAGTLEEAFLTPVRHVVALPCCFMPQAVLNTQLRLLPTAHTPLLQRG